MNTTWMSLSLLVWLPMVLGVVVYVLRHVAEGKIAHQIAFVSSLVMLLGVFGLFCAFDPASVNAQFVERAMWIDHFKIEYALGIDGLSMLFIVVNAVMTFAALLLCRGERGNTMAGALLITSGLTYGALTALDGALFYIFFEAMLIPTFFLVGIFGGEHRKAATIKFFLYTLLGSLFMLLALFTLYK
jgi:NADH-quinone oxidoreductase subunit M